MPQRIREEDILDSFFIPHFQLFALFSTQINKTITWAVQRAQNTHTSRQNNTKTRDTSVVTTVVFDRIAITRSNYRTLAHCTRLNKQSVRKLSAVRILLELLSVLPFWCSKVSFQSRRNPTETTRQASSTMTNTVVQRRKNEQECCWINEFLSSLATWLAEFFFIQ
jgi:hypothetical protein